MGVCSKVWCERSEHRTAFLGMMVLWLRSCLLYRWGKPERAERSGDERGVDTAVQMAAAGRLGMMGKRIGISIFLGA